MRAGVPFVVRSSKEYPIPSFHPSLPVAADVYPNMEKVYAAWSDLGEKHRGMHPKFHARRQIRKIILLQILLQLFSVRILLRAIFGMDISIKVRAL